MVFELSIFKNTQLITGVWTFNNDLFINDDKKLYFGTGGNYDLFYEAGNGLRITRSGTKLIAWNDGSTSAYINGFVYPLTSNDLGLGATSLEWKNLYLGEGADKTFGLNMGLGQEFFLFYNGSHAFIQNSVGNMYIQPKVNLIFDSENSVFIRDILDANAILWILDTQARTLGIGLITKRIDIDHFGKNDTQTNIIIPLENFVEGSATCNQVNFNSDVGEQYWDLIKATTPVLRLNSGIRPPAGVNTMVIKYRARVDVSVSVDFNVNYSLSGAAKVSGSSVVLSTTKTEYESAEITISDTDYINIDITHNSGANDVELFRMEINFFKI